MRDLPETRVERTRAVGDPPGEAWRVAIARARHELGPVLDLVDYERDVLGLVPDEEARDAT